MNDTIFLKLGGSLLTDKSAVEAVRPDVLERLAAEIGRARAARPSLSLLLGHGSGSFGHVAAARHGTRQGVVTSGQWHGFAEVSAAAARLNRLVVQALLAAGTPAVSLQPSASAQCEDGAITYLAHESVAQALAAGLLPVVYGDVAFDRIRGGTIIATEEIMAYLAARLQPGWLLLAGDTAGVLNSRGELIPQIDHNNLEQIRPALGGSRGSDVTGGMEAKVLAMLDLVSAMPQLSIRIFSGLVEGQVERLLLEPDLPLGTLIRGRASHGGGVGRAASA
jgi:isopentenyl phosphate kinase